MTQSEHPLQAALGRLADLVAPADAGAVSELQRRQAARAFRVLVGGEAKRGKSTLVNALIGRSLLPTGVVPLTAVATILCCRRPERVTVSYRTGGREVVALSRLDELVTEAGNPGNARGVDDVTVHLDVGLLSRGLELVDTPGTGSVHEHNTAQAVAAFAGMDAAIFVLSADPPISASERLWLREVRGQAVHVFCVLNKADYLAPADLVETLAFTRRVLAEELGTDLPAWPVSARLALGGGDASAGGDWDAFVDAFTGYLTNKQSSELDRSVASRAARLAAGVADQAAASLAALSLSQQDLDQRVAQFRLQVEQVQQDRFASAALLSASITRLKKQTDTEAAAVAQRAGQTLSRAVAARLGELRGPPAHVERQALAFAGEQIQGVVDGWRTGRATALDEAVHALDRQLGERLTEHVSAVRQAASTLFKLELGQLGGSGRLVASRRFAYSFGADVGQTEAAAAAVRARLPGAFGRRRRLDRRDPARCSSAAGGTVRSPGVRASQRGGPAGRGTRPGSGASRARRPWACSPLTTCPRGQERRGAQLPLASSGRACLRSVGSRRARRASPPAAPTARRSSAGPAGTRAASARGDGQKVGSCSSAACTACSQAGCHRRADRRPATRGHHRRRTVNRDHPHGHGNDHPHQPAADAEALPPALDLAGPDAELPREGWAADGSCSPRGC